MLFNYARFENPFEFGQKYQLSNWDQQNYGISNFSFRNLLNTLTEMFLQTTMMQPQFPYVGFAGIFFEFPIFLFGIIAFWFSPTVKDQLKALNLTGFISMLILTMVFITLIVAIMAPKVDERYHSDLNFLTAIMTFMIIGCYYNSIHSGTAQKLNVIFSVFALFTVIIAVLLFFIPYDFNFTGYFLEILDKLRAIFPVLN